MDGKAAHLQDLRGPPAALDEQRGSHGVRALDVLHQLHHALIALALPARMSCTESATVQQELRKHTYISLG